MGVLYSVTCKNKQCRYHIKLREGPGLIGFAAMKNFEKTVLSGETDNPIAKASLENGAEIRTQALYVCPCCREFKNSDIYYLIENKTESPFGTIRYDVRFPFGKPICKECNNELIYIKNIRSSKIVCPKCGSNLSVKLWGYID